MEREREKKKKEKGGRRRRRKTQEQEEKEKKKQGKDTTPSVCVLCGLRMCVRVSVGGGGLSDTNNCIEPRVRGN